LSYLLFFLFSTTARADLKFVEVDHTNLASVESPDVENQFLSLNIFKSHIVTYDRGGMTKAVLIDAWSEENHRDNIDTAYYRENKPVYYKIDKQFKDVYFSISPSAVKNLKAKLADEGIEYNPKMPLVPSNYVLKNGKLPATYSLNGKKVLLVLTTMGICVVRNHIVSTASPPKLFSKLPCPGGHTMWLSQINGIEYNPLCRGVMCGSPDEVVESVRTYMLKSSLVPLPDSTAPTQLINAAVRAK
jgi:hypothetical protein